MITVLYACNDFYIKQTIVSIASVLKHHKQVKLYLVSEELSQDSRDLLISAMDAYGQSVQIINAADILPDLDWDIHGRHPRTIYAKLFMEKAILEKRVLYLDSDTIINGSLEPLFVRNMEYELVAGVLMPYSSKLKKQINIVSGQPYICDGVVLFNMELWREQHKSSECVAYIQKYGGRPPMLSEGTLNYVCRGMIGTLKPKYNLMPAMLWYTLPQIWELFQADCYYEKNKVEELQLACTNPVVIHFMEELYNRPWREPCDHPYRDLYREEWEKQFGRPLFEKREISRHIKMTRWLYKWIPFSLFSKLYQVKNKWSGV